MRQLSQDKNDTNGTTKTCLLNAFQYFFPVIVFPPLKYIPVDHYATELLGFLHYSLLFIRK